MVLLAGLAVLTAIFLFLFLRKTKALPYSVTKVRELEMEIWGYYFTPAPDEKPKALPTGPAPGSRHPNNRGRGIPAMCETCNAVDVTVDGRSCQQCTHQILTERKKRREWEAKQTFPRKRHVVFQGVGYSALMPSEVPDNAHLEITGKDFMGYSAGFTWAVWTWTDEKTGKQMFMRSMAQEMERHDIITGNGQVVRSFYEHPDRPVSPIKLRKPVYNA